MKKLLSLILSFLMVLSTLPFVMASADVVLPETYGNDADFAALVGTNSTITLDKDYVLTEPFSSTKLSTINVGAYSIVYNPSAGNEDAPAISTTKQLTFKLDNSKSDFEAKAGTFVHYGTGYFFKSAGLKMTGSGDWGRGAIYGEFKIDIPNNRFEINADEANIYGDVVCTGTLYTSGAKVFFHGNVETYNFQIDRPTEFKGYLHITGSNVNFGTCNPYAGGCVVPYFSGTATYKGYTIYCEGNAKYEFDTEIINILSDNGRNILKKDMYVGGNLNVTWFGHTELGFSGKVVVGGNVLINNYQTKRATNHPTVTTPKNITFANLTCTNQALQLTENYHNADVENVVSVCDSGSAITVTPYGRLENVVVVKLDDENIFVGKKGSRSSIESSFLSAELRAIILFLKYFIASELHTKLTTVWFGAESPRASSE